VKSTEGLALGGMIEAVCSAHSVFHDGRSRAMAVRKLEIEDEPVLRTVKGTVTGLLSSPPPQPARNAVRRRVIGSFTFLSFRSRSS
jgi:hypothetical protein